MNLQFYKNDSFIVDDELWEQYTKTRDVGLRNQIVESYLYIVTTNIKRLNITSSTWEEVEDMSSQGVLALINSVDRYDYKRGVQFDSFASIRVRGAIIDYLRKRDWVPKGAKKRIRGLNETQIELQNELGRLPNDNEIADELGITTEDVENIRVEEMRMNIIEFEDFLESGVIDIPSVEEPESVILKDELQKTLAQQIDSLEEKEKNVLSLHYYEGLKLKEIAFVMDLTPSRISQIHSNALLKLKSRLQNYVNI